MLHQLFAIGRWEILGKDFFLIKKTDKLAFKTGNFVWLEERNGDKITPKYKDADMEEWFKIKKNQKSNDTYLFFRNSIHDYNVFWSNPLLISSPPTPPLPLVFLHNFKCSPFFLNLQTLLRATYMCMRGRLFRIFPWKKKNLLSIPSIHQLSIGPWLL